MPTLYVGGWYDTYTRATVENFVELSKRQSAPVHLLMGPWHHGGVGVPAAGDLSFLPEGGLSHYESVRLQWFDRFLKDLPTTLAAAPPVRYFLMGGGRGLEAGLRVVEHGGCWCEGATWPPPGVVPTPFYFHGEGRLASEPPAPEVAPTCYQYDPADPVPTIGGNLSAIPVPPGGFDQRNDPRFPFAKGNLPLTARKDVLCFESAPLEEDLVIAGPLVVNLWVATDGADTDFTAKLLDLYPPGGAYGAGAAINLADSILRLRFRNGFETEELAEAGIVYEVRFELYPTANRFVKGHRIRVDISSSNFPRFDVNPNTGGPLGRERRLRVAENTAVPRPVAPVAHRAAGAEELAAAGRRPRPSPQRMGSGGQSCLVWVVGGLSRARDGLVGLPSSATTGEASHNQAALLRNEVDRAKRGSLETAGATDILGS